MVISISTPAELADIGDDPWESYKLTNDIDLASWGHWSEVGDFYGTIDGDGYAIKNLLIEGTVNQSGFIRWLEGEFLIKNLIFEDPIITNTAGSGILSGLCQPGGSSQILNCHVVNGKTGPRGKPFIGKLSYSSGTVLIKRCSFDWHSDGGGPIIDEVVLWGNDGEILRIEECFSQGTVLGWIQWGEFGGLINTYQSYGGKLEIENCYSRVTIPDGEYLGGLVGYPNIGRTTDISISKSYFAGLFHAGGVYKGAMTGIAAHSVPVSDCYYDADILTGLNVNYGEIGKTTAQMKTKSTFENWDFDTIWGIHPSINDGYPVLRAFHPGVEFDIIPPPWSGDRIRVGFRHKGGAVRVKVRRVV